MRTRDESKRDWTSRSQDRNDPLDADGSLVWSGARGPIRRVLYLSASGKTVAIYLGPLLPAGSSSLPEDGAGRSSPTNRRCPPIWPCSGWGLPNAPITEGAGALLPHHFTLTAGRPDESRRPSAVCFCGTIRRVAPPGCYPAPCPAELGRSSPIVTIAAATRPPGSTSSLAGRIERRQSGGQLRGQPLRRLAVERLVSEPVGDAILLARHVLHGEAPEPAAQLQQPLVERPQLGVAHPVAPL